MKTEQQHQEKEERVSVIEALYIHRHVLGIAAWQRSRLAVDSYFLTILRYVGTQLRVLSNVCSSQLK